MQNTSHAVMAQRVEAHDSLDHFPTPPWATRALCEHVIELRGRTVWEPACGEGYMAKPLKEYAASMAQFVERVPMVKGRLDQGASTATSYCWLVWRRHSCTPTMLQWIPPCRAKLERAEDYP